MHDPSTTIITSLSSDDDDDEAMNDDADDEVTRQVIYKLALGNTAPQNPVDAKLEEMIRQTRLQLAVNKSKDDFDVETPYTHGSVTILNDRSRQRSNSLPQEWEGPTRTQDDGTKDFDMMM